MKIRTVLDYNNLFTHCSLVGATGSGKTTYILRIIQDVILATSNNNLIFIDGKNDTLLHNQLQEIARKTNYQFLNYTNSNKNSNFCYNCLQNKNYNEIKEIITRLRIKDINNISLGANYYFEQSNKLLFLIIKCLIDHKFQLSWTLINQYCDKKTLMQIIDKNDLTMLSSFKQETYNDVKTFLQTFLDNEILTNNQLSLNTILSNHKNTIILFSLDILSFPSQSRDIAQAICLDLRQSIKNKTCDLFCVLDEFGSYINQDLKTILEQGRSYKVGLILAYQSLAQINKENFKNIVFDNTNNWFIFHMKHEQSIKEITAIFGVKSSLEFNYSLNLKNKNMVNKYVNVRPTAMNVVTINDIKNLNPLECFIKTVKVKGYLSLGIQPQNDE